MDAREWVLNEDQVAQSDRIERLNWLAEQTPIGNQFWQFHGGLHTKYLFEEARYCFVYGQFLAVILLGLAFIEHTLASMFYASGHDELERASINRLLKEALSAKWITQEQFNHLDHARKIRNAFTHFRKPGDEESIEFKMIDEDKYPYEIIDDEARFIILAMFGVLERFSGV
jgi:hypothetical protein